MKKSKITHGNSLLIGTLSIAILCCMFCATASAGYEYEGYNLTNIESGTVKGDVYISCGNNSGLNPDYANWSYVQNTFVTNFSNVPTSGVKWAELKVGVWGGKTTRVGWAETRLDGTMLANETLNISAGLSNNVSCCGSGIYMIHYDCTDLVEANNNDGEITATVIATPDDSTGLPLDCRIYGAVLIVVYENGNSYTQYWVNQGNLNLHKQYGAYDDLDANITWFNGTACESGSSGNSSLTVAYFGGNSNQKDYLYLNAPDAADSPYNLSNPAWNKTKYADQQVGSDNVANSTCDELSGTTNYFDLHKFSVKNLVDHTNNNYAIFWRGHSDTIPINDPSWPGVNNEVESYVSPFLAVFKITEIATYDFSTDTAGRAGVDMFAYKYQVGTRPPNANNVPGTEFNTSEYNKIKADDNDLKEDKTNLNGSYAAHRFVFNVTDSASAISAINVTWNGKGWHEGGVNGTYLYIWNNGSYEELANCNDGNEQTLTGEKTANLSNYINNGQVTVLAVQKTAQSGARTLSHLETDYVRLLLKPNA